jgi:NlpC/P60 family
VPNRVARASLLRPGSPGLCSADLDPQPITVDKHVLPDYRTSRELYDHPRLAHLPRSAVRRGDLVFWRGNEPGRVNHVAIYLGGGNVPEAVEPRVRIGGLGDCSTQTMMPEVVRPFSAASPAASTAATEPRSTSPYAT